MFCLCYTTTVLISVPVVFVSFFLFFYLRLYVRHFFMLIFSANRLDGFLNIFALGTSFGVGNGGQLPTPSKFPAPLEFAALTQIGQHKQILKNLLIRKKKYPN